MNMKKTTIIMIIILALPFALAVGFSPTKLEYNLDVGEEECKIVTLSSDSATIAVSDLWAENKDIDWKVSLFETPSSEHRLNLVYDELLEGEDEVQVCLSGNKAGEYHGVLLLREEQQGNSIVQMGVWLKAVIEENQEEQEVVNNIGNDNSGNSNPVSGGGGSINDDEVLIEGEPEAGDFELEELAEPKIQGSVTGSSSKGTISIIVIVLAAIIIAGVIVYKKKSQNNVNMENIGVENV